MLDDVTDEKDEGLSKLDRSLSLKYARGLKIAEEQAVTTREQIRRLRKMRLEREAAGLPPIGTWDGPVRIATRASHVVKQRIDPRGTRSNLTGSRAP